MAASSDRWSPDETYARTSNFQGEYVSTAENRCQCIDIYGEGFFFFLIHRTMGSLGPGRGTVMLYKDQKNAD